MAKLGVVAAAEAAGVSRHTIWRYAKSGKLSCELTPAGDRVVDTSELVRVFGELHHDATVQQPSQGNGVHPSATSDTVAVLQRQVEEQRTEIERLRSEAAVERAERRALQDRYLAIIERLQITGPTTKPIKPAPRSRPKANTPPPRTPSAVETLVGSVAGWLGYPPPRTP